MSKTSSIIARVEPDLKMQAEAVLEQIGLPMSNAISLFLHQIVLHQGLPFELKIPRSKPLCYGDNSEEEFYHEIEKGLDDYRQGKTVTAQFVSENMNKKYGV